MFWTTVDTFTFLNIVSVFGLNGSKHRCRGVLELVGRVMHKSAFIVELELMSQKEEWSTPLLHAWMGVG